MNAKFFDVKKSKQDAIINAALKIFLANGYKKASTDVIVQEAGISKGLLFHYFISKKGLYEFICDYSVKYMTMELSRAVNKSEKDFFKVQVQVERAKNRVMKNYPYMHQFLNSLKFEKNADALEAIGNKCEQLDEAYKSIYCQTDNTRFLDKVDVNKIIDMISWMSDGFVRDKFRNPKPDLDEMSEEFEKYLNMLRRHFYRSATDDMVSIAREESVERDDSIMEQMRLDATFEERLLASKVSLADTADNSAKEEPEEEEPDTVVIAASPAIQAGTAEVVSESETKAEDKTESETKAKTETADKAETADDTEAASDMENGKTEAEETDGAESTVMPEIKVSGASIAVSSGAIPVAANPIKLWNEPEDTEDKEVSPIEATDETENDTAAEIKTEISDDNTEAEVKVLESITEILPGSEPEAEEAEKVVLTKEDAAEDILKDVLGDITEDENPAAPVEDASEAVKTSNDDEIAFPSWWTSSIAAVEEEPADSVVFNIPAQPSSASNGSSFGHYVDDALEAEISAGAASDFADLVSGAVKSVEATTPSVSPVSSVPENVPVMAEMPVPEDILKTTLKNDDDDDDDVPWTPRPVKQIRL